MRPSSQLSFAEWTTVPEVDLTSYDVILLNTSGGKDSQVMIDVVFHLAVAAGVTERLVAVHCDLGRVEWAGTRDLAERQCQHYGIAFEVVQAPGGDLLEHIERRGMFPDNQNRYCTSDLKRSPVRTLMTRLAERFHGGPHAGPRKANAGRPCRILNCMGLRAEESPARAKRPAFSYDKAASNKTRRHVDEWLPIHHWTTDEVWARIRESNVPHHFAYDLGMPRLSCVFCIFAPREALLIGGLHNPELLADYVGVEGRIRHTFRQNQTLIEIQTALAAGERPRAITTWALCA